MTLPLDGKVAIVTGAAEGIGAATARRLVKLGASVVIHYNSRTASAEALARELRDAGGRVELVQANLLEPEAANTIVDFTVKTFGRIDALVNNAGLALRGLLPETTPAFVEDQFKVNTYAVIYLIQAAAPHFPPEGGAIVNVTTNLVRNPAMSMAVYSASKAAVTSLTLCLAKELSGKHITVNAVEPGATQTAMSSAMTPEQVEAMGKKTPLGRMGQPDDIAGAICFFILPEGRWCTGQSLMADGGFTEGAFGWVPN